MKLRPLLLVALIGTATTFSQIALADPAPLVAAPGWVVTKTAMKYDALVHKLDEAVKANKMGVVNFASASDGAKAQGITISGNRVVGGPLDGVYASPAAIKAAIS